MIREMLERGITSSNVKKILVAADNKTIDSVYFVDGGETSVHILLSNGDDIIISADYIYKDNVTYNPAFSK